MADNLATWEALRTPDPEHTKKFTRAGGFRGTAIKPIYCDHQMTKLFGPCGEGWTISEPTFQLVNGPEGEVAVYCWLTLTVGNGKPIPGVGGDFAVKKTKYGLTMDDEAFKKAETDAIGNAMKHLGMAADIHMGLFDDSKYVAEIGRDQESRTDNSTVEPAHSSGIAGSSPAPSANDDPERAKRLAWVTKAEAHILTLRSQNDVDDFGVQHEDALARLKAADPELSLRLQNAIAERWQALSPAGVA